MSRIGKLPINVPAGVTISVQDTVVTVKGPKGVLTQEIDPHINMWINFLSEHSFWTFYGNQRILYRNCYSGRYIYG